jgi:hypothetical protein
MPSAVTPELGGGPAHYREQSPSTRSISDAEMGRDFPDHCRDRRHFFADVEAASAMIKKWLFGIFIVLFLGALIIGLTIGAKLTS